jgi:hypothetical protein
MTWCEKDYFAIYDDSQRKTYMNTIYAKFEIFPIKKAFPNKNPERPFAISNTFPL